MLFANTSEKSSLGGFKVKLSAIPLLTSAANQNENERHLCSFQQATMATLGHPRSLLGMLLYVPLRTSSHLKIKHFKHHDDFS